MRLEKAVCQMYDGCERLIIIGLTGRTGSGCSTVAKILETEKLEQLDLKEYKAYDFLTLEERKNRIIYEYMKENKWQKFSVIEVSSIILASALELGEGAFINYISKLAAEEKGNIINIGDKDKVVSAIKQIGYMFEDCKKYSLGSIDEDCIKRDIEGYYNFYIRTIKEYKNRFKDILEGFTCFEIHSDKMRGKRQSQYHLYTYLLQQMGNNIRCSGNPFEDTFSEEKYGQFITKIDLVIKIIINYNKINGRYRNRICIDAIRNPYEAMFFKDHYRGFHLVAVNTDDGGRKLRLKHLNAEELLNLDKIEYAQKMKKPQEIFYHQNIQGCIQNADIHIYNPNIQDGKYFQLTEQILKYIGLMLHPGLVTPTNVERCMQLAYNVKFNSGCLSRQVGAVVTREDFSIQSVGWNDVPKGQISCNLREVHSFRKNKDKESYSLYEIEDEDFNEALARLDEATFGKTCGRCMSYCFKDVYNGLKGDKNQVYTRSLHAEENAFLQISKYGGTRVKGGYLFSTASPCELCAKKAYQLGIKCIYYIDPYPGISQKHILTFGTQDNPEMKLFFGAIGQAYLDFYEPRIAIKDELELLTGVNVKGAVRGKKESDVLDYGDVVYNEAIIELMFMGDRNRIENRRTIKGEIKKQGIERISKKIFWTGSSYDGTELVKERSDPGISLIEKDSKLPYRYDIILGKKSEKGDRVSYQTLTKVKDEKHVMEPYLAHMVKHGTEKLILKVVSPKGMLSDAKLVIYADLDMKTMVYTEEIEKKESEDSEIYERKIENANVNYTYALEWKFKQE